MLVPGWVSALQHQQTVHQRLSACIDVLEYLVGSVKFAGQNRMFTKMNTNVIHVQFNQWGGERSFRQGKQNLFRSNVTNFVAAQIQMCNVAMHVVKGLGNMMYSFYVNVVVIQI